MRGISWSPVGGELAIASDEGLFVTAADGTGRSLLVARRGENDGVEVPRDPQWSPDGRYIGYIPQYYEGSGRVTLVKPTGGQAIVSISLLLMNGPADDAIWACDLSTGKLGLLEMSRPVEGSLFWAADGTVYSCGGSHLTGLRLTR